MEQNFVDSFTVIQQQAPARKLQKEHLARILISISLCSALVFLIVNLTSSQQGNNGPAGNKYELFGKAHTHIHTTYART